MKRSTKVSLAVTASAGLFVVGSATGAVGAKLITGHDIAPKTVTGKNLAPASVGKHKLKPALLDLIENAGTTGAPGPQGATGPKGDKGEQGEQGDPATVQVQEFLTSSADDGATEVGGSYLVPVPANGGGGDTETPILSFHLDAGTYRVDATAEFFGGSDSDTDYGVMTMYRDGVNVPGTAWTPDLPGSGDPDDAAQTTGSQVVTVPDGGAEISVRGSIRGDDDGYAGAQAIVTEVTRTNAPPPPP